MASRLRHLGLASVVISLFLVCALGDTIAGSPEAVNQVALTMPVNASTDPLACDTSGACFDIQTFGPTITHVFVDSGCGASPSDFLITVDGEPVIDLHTDGGPCESIPRDVWFPLPGNQERAEVCVVVQAAGPEGIQVSAKAGEECIAAIPPL